MDVTHTSSVSFNKEEKKCYLNVLKPNQPN